MKERLKRFWEFLKKDTWQSWLVSIILVVIIIKFIFFPVLSLITGTPLPLVVVESCSMYHESTFEDWWSKNSDWYETRGVMKQDFQQFPMKNGLNKGDIIFVWGYSNYTVGDIIIFNANTRYPLIHRIVSLDSLSTKGDHNSDQIRALETNISKDAVVGKAIVKIPLLGWIKLIFFEFSKDPSQRGICA